MTTELLETPVLAEKTHEQLMQEIEACLFAKTGKHQRVIHAYPHAVVVISYQSGKEERCYRTSSIEDAERWCERNGFDSITCDLRKTKYYE